ncbi:MAG: hypothetical protein JW867_03880, partial [Candidatus Omnitrophica bacterium]|nr:hypothetical protein [Candidatus Omnitrophota bacterium]
MKIEISNLFKAYFLSALFFYSLFFLTGCEPGTPDQMITAKPKESKATETAEKEQVQNNQFPEEAEISLQGIIYDSEKPLAVINGEIIHQGGLVGNKRVVQINSTSVELIDVATKKISILEIPTEPDQPQPDSPKEAVSKDSDSTSKDFGSDLLLKAMLIDSRKVLIYFPSMIYTNKKYPLIVVFS